MSTFKSFASQPSLGDYLIQVPDETAKIKEQTRETVRKMNRAEQFRQGNADLYLRAQKLAQDQEEYSRKLNYDLETQNRKFYRDTLDRDNNIQIANDRVAAQQQLNTYEKIAQYSKTAADLVVDFNTKITENQTNSNTVNTLIAGTTFEENLAIKGMINNLTEAEFAQTDFIKAKVAEGKDLKALWTLYNNRNTRGFIENAGVIQNTANGATPFLQEVLKNLDQNLTPTQKRLQVETSWREWLANSFKDANGRQLNPKLVANLGAPIYSRAYTNVMGEIDREEDVYNKEQIRINTDKNWSAAWGDGVLGVTARFQEGHKAGFGERYRTELTDWMIRGLKAGTLSVTDAESIMKAPYNGPNNKLISWQEQFPTDPNLGRLRAAIDGTLSANNARFRAKDAAQNNAAEMKIREYLDTALEASGGVYTPEAQAVVESMITQLGTPGYSSPAHEDAVSKYSLNALEAQAQEKDFEAKYRAGTLTPEYILGQKTNSTLAKKYLPLAKQQVEAKQGPLYDVHVDAIEDTLATNPVTKEKLNSWTVGRKQHDMKLRYQEELVKTNYDHNAAFGVVMGLIQAEQAAFGAIDAQGHYASVLKKHKEDIKAGTASVARRKEIVKQAANREFRTNPRLAANFFGAEIIYSSYDNMKAGGLPHEDVQYLARQLQISDMDAMNFLIQGANNPELKQITVEDSLKGLVSNINPSTRRQYYGQYRNTEAANYSNPNVSRGGLPVRSSLAGIAPTGTNTGLQTTDAADGKSGVDHVIENGRRGAGYYFPLGGKILKVVNNMNEEYRLEEGDTRRSFGNRVEVQITVPELGNRKVDVLIAHFDKVNDLRAGDIIPTNYLLGTQGRTGSTTGAHISLDFFIPGTNIPDSAARDWYRNKYLK